MFSNFFLTYLKYYSKIYDRILFYIICIGKLTKKRRKKEVKLSD